MDEKNEPLNQSVGLVRSLFQNCYIKGNAVASIQQISSENPIRCRLDVKGSTRVELLFDEIHSGAKTKTINLHGLAENSVEEKVPLVLYCETTWSDDTEVENMFAQVANSVVIDLVEHPSMLCDTLFSVTFEDPDDGKVIGRGEGYVQFERNQ